MKTHHCSTFARIRAVVCLSSVLALTACGNSAQKTAYASAVRHEEAFTLENAPALIAEFRQVIAIEPGTSLAGNAQTRIVALEARVKAEEQRKSVFQEHGVD